MRYCTYISMKFLLHRLIFWPECTSIGWHWMFYCTVKLIPSKGPPVGEGALSIFQRWLDRSNVTKPTWTSVFCVRVLNKSKKIAQSWWGQPRQTFENRNVKMVISALFQSIPPHFLTKILRACSDWHSEYSPSWS